MRRGQRSRVSNSQKCLVMGAGITGLSTPLELLQCGRRVIVSEATVVGAHPDRRQYRPSGCVQRCGLQN